MHSGDLQVPRAMRFWRHGSDSMRDCERFGSTAVGGACGGSAAAAEARGEGADRSGVCRVPAGTAGRRGGRGQPTDGLALATALAEAGVEGLLRDKTRKPGKAPIPAETVARVVALDRSSNGPRGRHLAALGAAHLAGPPASAASSAELQAIARPGVRRQARRCRGPLSRSAAHAVVLSIDEKRSYGDKKLSTRSD